MKQIFLRFLLVVAGLLLRFRYRITYKGLDKVKSLLADGQKGCLFLPNHPAVLVDPLIVSLPLVRLFKIRPLIIEYMYFHPAFHWAVRLLGAIAIPNFGSAFSPLKLKRAERALKTISSGLKANDRFLIYPSGTTKMQAKEIVGGAFGVHQLVSENPDVPIVLVRMTGLWGSSFSRAATNGATPHTKQAVKRGVWTAIKNLFFFVPKRNVLVEFEIADDTFPRKAEKQQFNRYLENWYNKPFGPDGEPLLLVSYAFWKKQCLQMEQPHIEKIDCSTVADEIKKPIIEKVAELAKIPAKQVLPDLKLIENLGLDSLDHAELISFLEREFNVSGIAPEKLTTVGSLFLFASGKIQTEEIMPVQTSLKGWNNKRSSRPIVIPEGNSIPEVFLRTCDEKGSLIACSDPIRGPMSYYACKKTVLLLTEHIAKLKGDRIGILLPASCLSYLLVIACQMAGKTPVMINWTVGGKHLDTVVDVSGIQVVLSSWAFLDALDSIDISRIEPLLVVLEELKAEISILDLLKASWKSRRKSILPKIDGDKEACVLFTSGTESMPKGVPLTHTNILSDLRAAMQTVSLFENDKLLAMLPPFHSFGFTVTGLLPLLSGFTVAYFPNPTDSKGLAHAIDRYSITVLCSAPTFLKNIMQFASSFDVSSVRMVISGAEKASDEFFALFKKVFPKVLFVEGYGITECSPILCANQTGDRKFGVGKAIGGVTLKIVDPEHLEKERAVNEVGLILAAGPNIFSGYLNKVNIEPFITLNGISWYQTGDLGSLDQAGNLILSGRLKRFVKIGGEMISLAAIEEGLSHQHNSEPNHFVVVTDGDVLGKVALVLFTTYKYETQEINQILRKNGFSNLVKIDRVIQLEAIPQTATGKIAYGQLDKLLGCAQE